MPKAQATISVGFIVQGPFRPSQSAILSIEEVLILPFVPTVAYRIEAEEVEGNVQDGFVLVPSPPPKRC